MPNILPSACVADIGKAIVDVVLLLADPAIDHLFIGETAGCARPKVFSLIRARARWTMGEVARPRHLLGIS